MLSAGLAIIVSREQMAPMCIGGVLIGLIKRATTEDRYFNLRRFVIARNEMRIEWRVRHMQSG